MDATPEKFYYVPMPRLRRLGKSDLARLPRLHIPIVPPLAAKLVRNRRTWRRGFFKAIGAWCATQTLATISSGQLTWRSGRKGAESWWVAHTLEVAVWTLGTALALAVGVVVARL
jgi:hypothetical protein